MKRVPIKVITREAGASPAAGSRVFAKRARSVQRMQEKMLAVARSLDYRPPVGIRELVNDRTKPGTLVAGRTVVSFDAIFPDRFSETMSERSSRLLLTSTVSSKFGDAGFLRARNYHLEAAVVSAVTMSLDHSEDCQRAGLFIMLMGLMIDLPGVDRVLAGNSNGARQAAELFSSTGPVKAMMRMLPSQRPWQCWRLLCGRTVCFAASISLANWRSFRLTAMDCPKRRAIEAVVYLLDKHVAGPGWPTEVRHVYKQLIVRATTRKILPGT